MLKCQIWIWSYSASILSIAQTESSVGFHYFDVDINNQLLKTDLSISQVRTEQLVESINDFSRVSICGQILR